MDSKADVGVIVGRFQVDKLHDGHIDLISNVIKTHPKTIIFLGVTPLKCTIKNPLDFESRKQMILKEFPDVIVLYIKDQKSNKRWSENLDEQIKDITGPNKSIILYGGRDSFIPYYEGKFDCIELKEVRQTNGTMIRDGISKSVKESSDFRSGIIWATQNQFINALPTVDIAIFNNDETEVLLCRKPYRTMFQFIGGFVDAGENHEQAARREVGEETGLIEVGDMEYVGCDVIDDWRYKGEIHKISTIFFKTTKLFGSEKPQDDIEELKWFKIDELKNVVAKQHQNLLNMLIKENK